MMNINLITQKQILLLFLISCDPGVREIYKMVKLYNRACFNFEIGENLQSLLDNNYIVVSRYFDNNTPNEYCITLEGIKFLELNLKENELIDFVKTLDNPKLLLEITTHYINNKKPFTV